ncbi:MAG TPA: lysophospholipid acyltransferase family protein [Kofleriaceae bacterium]|nr:lysophospholipid acyltransferase family protein [Kofleriaceae bacterium]
MPLFTPKRVLARVDRLGLSFGRHGIDPYGISRVDLARMFAALGVFYRHYFRVTTHGLENVPASGRAMLVGNHSGGYAIDGAMLLAAMFFAAEPPRLAQGMAEKFINRLPFASQWTSRIGQLTGLPEHAIRLLEDDRLLMVFPEGARGTAKLYGDRNTLVGFGTGFLRLALATGTPILPVAILGGGEALPTVLNLYRLGHLVGMPYIPITPYIVPIPRPVAIDITVSEAMHFEGTGTEDDAVIASYVDQVKDRIAELIDDGFSRRRGGDSR